MNYYIGLDAHSTTSTFAVLDEKGKLVDQARLSTSEESLAYYLKKLTGTKSLVFEESSLAKWLYVTLKDKVQHLVVANPIHIDKKSRAKTDFRDALNLAEELRCNHILPVFHNGDDHLIELRTTVSGYLALVTEIVRAKNRFKDLFRSQALPADGQSIYSDFSRINELPSDSLRLSADCLMYQISVLEEIKARYIDRFRETMKDSKMVQNLATIPGIDVVRANVIAAIVCEGRRFKNKHHFWSYCMLIVHKQISDDRIYGWKAAVGRRELKNVFRGCALSVLRGQSSLRKKYDRLRSQGYSDRNAKQVIARDCASIALAIMKKNAKYDDEWREKRELNSKRK